MRGDDAAALHEELIEIVRRAGAEIMDVYATDFDVETKSDSSPVTQADLRAHAVIVAGLRGLAPEYPILSEESEPPEFEIRRTWSRYWLVDPLDGTREFVGRNGEFTVNIALIDGHRPVLGVVGVPVGDEVFLGDVALGRAYKDTASGRQPLAARAFPETGGLTVMTSRSHGSARLESYLDGVTSALGPVTRRSIGSSLKLCLLAEGEADFYPRLGPTSEWDIGAAQAVLTAAGGAVRRFDGRPLDYNAKPSFLNPEFMAVGDPTFPWGERLPPVPSA